MRRLLIALPLLPLLLAGCGEETVNQDELKAGIVSDLAKTGAKVRDVECGEVKPETGATFKCTMLNQSDTTLRFEGKVTSAADGRARFAGTVVGGTAKGTSAAKEAKKVIEDAAGTTVKSVTCPEKVEIPTKPPVTCATTTNEGDVFDTSVEYTADGTIKAQVAEKPR